MKLEPGSKPDAPDVIVAALPKLSKRMFVRVPVPRSLTVYARLRSSVRATGSCRGIVTDLGAAGLAARIIEGGRFDLPREGQEVVAELDFEGTEARVHGRAVRAGAQEVALAFTTGSGDEDQNDGLLAVIARVVLARLVPLERRRYSEGLAARLSHRRFDAAGALELRIQPDAPRWWQLVFLEYLLGWSEEGGLESGTIDRSFSAERATDPLAPGPAVTRHPRPWRSIRRLGLFVATQARLLLPEHADTFSLIEQIIDSDGAVTATAAALARVDHSVVIPKR